MRFGLVHRVMTDALAALGVLAVVSTASLSPWTNLVLARRARRRPRHPRGLAGPAGAAPLRDHRARSTLLLVAGRAPPRRPLAARRRRRVRGAPPDHPPRDAARRRARPADHRPRAAALRRGDGPRRRAHLRALLPRVPRRRARARSSSATCGARSRATTARARATAPGLPVDVPRILRSRRVVGRGFLAATCLLSVPILLFTTALFVLFPRVGLSLLLLNHPHAGRMIGFSEHVDLGDVGVLRDDPTIALRFEVEGPARSAARAPHASPARHGVRRLRRARLAAHAARPAARPTTGSTATTSTRIFRGPDAARDRVVSFDLEPIDPPVIFLPPRAVALRVKPQSQILLGEPLTRPARGRGRAPLRRLGRARAPLRRLPRRRRRGPRRAAVARRPRALPRAARGSAGAHRRPRAPAGPTTCRRPRRRRAPSRTTSASEYGYDLNSPSQGTAAARRPLPLRVAARPLRVLLDGDGDDAPRRRHPVAQRDRLRRRHVEPLRASTTRCARGTRTRGSRPTSTIRATRAGRPSTRRPPSGAQPLEPRDGFYYLMRDFVEALSQRWNTLRRRLRPPQAGAPLRRGEPPLRAPSLEDGRRQGPARRG